MTPARRSVRTQAANARKPTTRSVTMPQQRHDTSPPSPRQIRTESAVEDEEEEDEEEDEDEEEEESSDGASVTRCLCGQQNNSGLMVQCDKCEVWQHCDCVGLTEQEIPELYYCDECQPNNHVVLKTHGRFKRAYNPNGGENTEDNQQNNDDTLEKQVDESEARAAKRRKRETNGTRKTTNTNNKVSRRQPTTSTPMATRTQKNGIEKHEATTDTTYTQGKDSTLPPDQTKHNNKHDEQQQSQQQIQQLQQSTPRRTRRKSGDDNNNNGNNNLDSSPPSEEPLASPPVSRGRKQTKSGVRRNNQQHRSPQRQTNGRHKESPRASTPLINQDDASNNGTGAPGIPSTPTLQLYWDEDGLPARESSPPAKVKYPNPKMSFADMNKRVKQIMDYVNKMQAELPKKQPKPECGVKRQRTRSDSTSSSSSTLSSASTLPLLEDDEHHPNYHHQQQKYSHFGSMTSPTTPIPIVEVQQETAKDMADRITYDLLQFKRKFGGSLVASSDAMVSSPRAKKFYHRH
ncbi:hypothetical protein INT45_007068 [Circinella minor]|uniref:PHD-type domain-containing protein n=1 Tax=Circinella minor TaxID=1195481 RepID=A0A8H7S8W6_9FUNG|nr:hypothetical protein INT45_007068 [Circinella minor]